MLEMTDRTGDIMACVMAQQDTLGLSRGTRGIENIGRIGGRKRPIGRRVVRDQIGGIDRQARKFCLQPVLTEADDGLGPAVLQDEI